MAGADKIIGVDINPAREALARQLRHDALRESRATSHGDLVAHLVELTGGGADYSFECVGNVEADAPGARVLPPRLGRQRHHRRRRRRARRSRRARSSSSPAACGRARRSAARAGAPTCRSIVDWYMDRKIDDRPADHAQAAARTRSTTRSTSCTRASRSAPSSSTECRATRRCRSEHARFDGAQGFYEHDSDACAGPMQLRRLSCRRRRSPAARVPALYFLAGLTCTEETFAIKAGAQRVAARAGPDAGTPRHQPARHALRRRRRELGLRQRRRLLSRRDPGAVGDAPIACTATSRTSCRRSSSANFPVTTRARHLRPLDGRPRRADAGAAPSRSLSQRVGVRADRARRSQVPWGVKAFTRYLGADRAAWAAHDAAELVRQARVRRPLLVDQGTERQVPRASSCRPELLARRLRRAGTGDSSCACTTATTTAITSSPRFVADHLRHHARHLGR